jgi:hypothetical protein
MAREFFFTKDLDERVDDQDRHINKTYLLFFFDYTPGISSWKPRTKNKQKGSGSQAVGQAPPSRKILSNRLNEMTTCSER